ncbi:DegT/DnrJ/EryC1/StrS family aminotransferase [Labilibaculum sp. K2S]|uniref:DegT/DnrJ/EryC1/StrS family aminotransferase n=1 Tax=Labilibaculum sp. K2S TaxID=3056386 RepID=UPI0025A4138F|nr:DegT/DnrJ/EryC1/StrS family aminotransferase [Labilibaculum sp. K2S]MDM8160296.1 DegT/DnrJ/EryC1/StrS family aminotransferase [Labilibaculum sp. K2S]
MIPFSPPHITQEAIDEVVDTLKSGWITTGPKTKRFEKEISTYCGNESTLCVNSATFGLELVLRWFGVGPGDEVIVPAYTYCASANVIVHTGATPVMVDINADDFNINLEALENAITSRTKVIIPVDIAGLPCDYDAINSLVCREDVKAKFRTNDENQAKLGRILVLSDAAHSFGAKYKGKHTGSLTDVSVFSFHAVKNLTTGEGGAIALNLPESFNNEEIYKAFNTFSLHGQNKDALAKTQKGAWKYDVLYSGYKGNMTDIMASLGLIDLKYYESKTLLRRKEIMNAYQMAFLNCSWAELPIIEDESRTSSFHLYPLRIKGISEDKRDAIIQSIFGEDVSVNVHFQPLPLLSAFKNMGYSMDDYPVAYDNYSREISLPVFYNLSDEQVQLVIDAVIKSVNANE